jgi:hypothetical protein
MDGIDSLMQRRWLLYVLHSAHSSLVNERSNRSKNADPKEKSPFAFCDATGFWSVRLSSFQILTKFERSKLEITSSHHHFEFLVTVLRH